MSSTYILEHITRYETAIRILSSKTIFSLDELNQANFFLLGEGNRGQVTEIEITLRFAWQGKERIMDVEPWGKTRFAFTEPNLLYHICNSTQDFPNNGYRQSVLLIGSTDIEFIGLGAMVDTFSRFDKWKKTRQFKNYIGQKIEVAYPGMRK